MTPNFLIALFVATFAFQTWGQSPQLRGKESGNAKIDRDGKLTDHRDVCEEEVLFSDFIKRYDLSRYSSLEQTIEKWNYPLYILIRSNTPIICITKLDISEILNVPHVEGRVAGWLPNLQNQREYIFIQQSILSSETQVSKETLGEVLMRERLQSFSNAGSFAPRDLLMAKVMKTIFEVEAEVPIKEKLSAFNEKLRSLQFATSESLPLELWYHTNLYQPEPMNKLISFIKNGGRVQLAGQIYIRQIMPPPDFSWSPFEALLQALRDSRQVMQLSEKDTWRQVDSLASVLSFDPVGRPDWVLPWQKSEGPIADSAKVSRVKDIVDLFVRYPDVLKFTFRTTNKKGLIETQKPDPLTDETPYIHYISHNHPRGRDSYAFLNWGVLKMMDLGLLPKTAILKSDSHAIEANICQMLFVFNSIHTSEENRDRRYLQELTKRCDTSLMVSN